MASALRLVSRLRKAPVSQSVFLRNRAGFHSSKPTRLAESGGSGNMYRGVSSIIHQRIHIEENCCFCFCFCFFLFELI